MVPRPFDGAPEIAARSALVLPGGARPDNPPQAPSAAAARRLRATPVQFQITIQLPRNGHAGRAIPGRRSISRASVHLFQTGPTSMSSNSRNEALFERAQLTIPGGVNSPVRAFRSVGGTPRFIERAQGAYFWDADGQRYIDYIGSWGPMILGHVHPEVLEAVQKVLVNGFRSARPPTPKSKSPKKSASWCRRSNRCAWCQAAQKPP
jgi:hypothetical protein